MTEIRWERDYNKAGEETRKTGKPVFHDFWLDG